MQPERKLRERREVLKRVVEFEDFSICWPNNQLKAKGLVAEIRRVVDVKDSFGRMRQEQEAERKQRLDEEKKKVAAQNERKAKLEQVKKALFAACGLQLSPDIKTITAKTLFERLGHIEKAFDSRHQRFCEQMALRRNAELHSGESPFSGMSAEAWEREFWGTVETFLNMQDETLESWLGGEDSKAPAKIIEQAEEAMQWAVKHRVSRCKEDSEKKYQDPKRRQERIEESKKLTWNDFTWDGRGRSACPACLSSGFLGGTLWNEEVVASEPGWSRTDDRGEWYGEPPSETVKKTFTVEAFLCPVCGLHLFGTKEIAAAELPAEFSQTEDREREFEEDYGND